MKAHTRVISIPNIFCKLHHMGLTSAEDIFRISEEIPKANWWTRQARTLGKRSRKCAPCFCFVVVPYLASNTFFVNNTEYPQRTKGPNISNGTWLKRGGRHHFWGPRRLLFWGNWLPVIILTCRAQQILISYSRSAWCQQRTHCTPKHSPCLS